MSKKRKPFVRYWFILNTYLFKVLQLLDVSISTFVSEGSTPVGIMSSVKGLKVCVITAGIIKV